MNPSQQLLNPLNHALIMIDFESQMAFATHSITMTELRANTAIVAGTSKIFQVPTVITTVAEASFAGPVFPEIESFYPKASTPYIDRTSMNTWEDEAAYKAIVATGKKKLVMTGLWTGVCIVGPALSAIAEGFEVYVLTDACGDVSAEAHERSVQRMQQVGVQMMTSVQYTLELQRDWARQETYVAVTDLMKKYAGSYGLGLQYAHTMLKH